MDEQPDQPSPKRFVPAYYSRRRHPERPRHGPRILVLIAFVLLSALVLFGGWKWFQLANRAPAVNPRQSIRDRAAIVATIDKMLAGTGKNVPPTDIVINSAVFHDRGGQRYLTGAVQNRSMVPYSSLHLIFDTYDARHNPAGTVEGDVGRLAAGEEAPFEIGPASPNARTCAIQSIEPVK